MFKGLMIAGVVAVGFAGSASASVTFTEGFETPNPVGSWYVYDTVGDNWTVQFGAGIEIQKSGTVVKAQGGSGQYIELDSDNNNGGKPGDTNTMMARPFGDIDGGEYTVTFFYQPRTSNEFDNGIQVGIYNWANDAVNGVFGGYEFVAGYPAVSPDFEYDQNLTDQHGWQQFSFNFTVGDNDSIALGFTSLVGNPDRRTYGGFIDTVEVSAVPEPATWLMMLAGFGLVGFNLKRRKAATLAA